MNALSVAQHYQLVFQPSRDDDSQWFAESGFVRLTITVMPGGHRSIALQEYADVSFVPCVDRLFPASRCPAGFDVAAMRPDAFSACKANCRWKERGVTFWREVSGFRGLSQLRRELAVKSEDVEGSAVLFMMTWVIDGKTYPAAGQSIISKAVKVIKQFTSQSGVQ